MSVSNQTPSINHHLVKHLLPNLNQIYRSLPPSFILHPPSPIHHPPSPIPNPSPPLQDPRLPAAILPGQQSSSRARTSSIHPLNCLPSPIHLRPINQLQQASAWFLAS